MCIMILNKLKIDSIKKDIKIKIPCKTITTYNLLIIKILIYLKCNKTLITILFVNVAL